MLVLSLFHYTWPNIYFQFQHSLQLSYNFEHLKYNARSPWQHANILINILPDNNALPLPFLNTLTNTASLMYYVINNGAYGIIFEKLWTYVDCIGRFNLMVTSTMEIDIQCDALSKCYTVFIK